MAAEPLSFPPRSFADILRETWAVYRRRFLLLLSASILMAVVSLALWLLSQLSPLGASDEVLKAFEEAERDPAAARRALALAFDKLPVILAGSVLVGVVGVALFILDMGVYIYVFAAHYTAQEPSLVRAVGFSLRRLPAAFGASLLVGLAILGSSLAWIAIAIVTVLLTLASDIFALLFILVIPLFFGVLFLTISLLIQWLFVLHVAFLEGAGPRQALSRSSHLVRGSWWRVNGIFGLPATVLVILNLATGFLLPFFSPTPSQSVYGDFTSTVLLSVLGIPIGPVLPLIMFLLYVDLRTRKEGFGPAQLGEALRL